MSVLIKGLKKPKDCYQCRLHYGHGECGVSVDGNCPLIELPDHGDLVDVDLLKTECKEPNVWWETETQMARILKDATVVIPAERGEE